MREHIQLIVLFLALVIGVMISISTAFAEGEESKPVAGGRETVLDRVVHLETNIMEIPDVPPLCDSFKGRKQKINIGDCELYCETEGQGLPIVLINGGPGGTHHGFHPDFSRAAGFATVVYYDQRGCGQSDYKSGGKYTVDQAVNDLNKLREALKIEQWIVLGWSYGGFLAQCYIVKYPERTAGLVLVGAQEAMPLKLNKTRQYDYISREEQKRIREIHRDKTLPLDKIVYNAHLNGDWKRQGFYRPTETELAYAARYEWKHDPAFRDSICSQMGNVDLTGMFNECPIPVLIAEGKWDLTWNTDKPEKMQKCFPGSKLVIFERSSHGMFKDEPEKFFGMLKKFVQNSSRPSAAAIAKWKAVHEEKKKKLEAEKKKVSQEITFRTAEKAPRDFDSWTFFWESPAMEEGALMGFQVKDGGGKVYHEREPGKWKSGISTRSDFSKEWDGIDPAVLYDKDITVRLWVTRGQMTFSEMPKYYFEFYKKGGNKPIRKIPAVMEQKSASPVRDQRVFSSENR
jgi:proline iminopeptidase